MLFIGLNKKIHEITTNDLRYYLAMYQEQRKISLSIFGALMALYKQFLYMGLADEGYINRDPSRRLRRVKVPQKLKKPYTAEEREHLKRYSQDRTRRSHHGATLQYCWAYWRGSINQSRRCLIFLTWNCDIWTEGKERAQSVSYGGVHISFEEIPGKPNRWQSSFICCRSETL